MTEPAASSALLPPQEMNWRDAAIQLFPELAEAARHAESPYQLWFDIVDAFQAAYRRTSPDESLITRAYRFAYWCHAQPPAKSSEDDLGTAASVCFIEELAKAGPWREDLPRWFSLKDMDFGGSPFRYHLSDAEWLALKAFMKKNAHRYQPGLLSGEAPRPRPTSRRKRER